MTAPEKAVAKKNRTIKDLVDEMTPAERDLQALIVGAALEDVDLSGDEETVSAYNALSAEHKNLVDFLVGNALAEESLKHSEPELDNFLAHIGVKGMKWGVRKTDSTGGTALGKTVSSTERSAARAKVKAGAGTLGDAHKAALKTPGHRTVNALLGDKTYWKRIAQITGGSLVAGVGVITGVELLPDSLLSSLGESQAGPGLGGRHLVEGADGAVRVATNKEVGKTVAAAAGITAVSAAGNVATVASQVTNLGRAVRGNARIDKSYASLGSTLKDRQTSGSAKVTKLLKTQGGLRGKDLKHSEPRIAAFLEHYADTPVKLVHEEV